MGYGHTRCVGQGHRHAHRVGLRTEVHTYRVCGG